MALVDNCTLVPANNFTIIPECECSSLFEYNGWIIEIDSERFGWHWTMIPKQKRNDTDCDEFMMWDSLPFGEKFASFQDALNDACFHAQYDWKKLMDEEAEESKWEWNYLRYVLVKRIYQKPKKKYRREPRGSLNYAWQTLIKHRDGYKCKKCGSITDIEAHHIKHYGKYPELRYELSNGITLCKQCHKDYHKKNGK